MIANARDYTGDPTHAAACATLGRDVVHMTVREWRCWPLDARISSRQSLNAYAYQGVDPEPCQVSQHKVQSVAIRHARRESAKVRLSILSAAAALEILTREGYTGEAIHHLSDIIEAMHERRDSLIANLRNLRKWRIPPC